MTQTIEQLTARVRELEEENMALVKTIQRDTLTSLRQLAATQAYAEQLREALETLNKVSNIGCCLVEKALALSHSTSALDAYVANQREAAYQEARRAADQFEAGLTRQRDLAVEAASDAATSLETIQLRSFGEESYLDSKPQMRAFAGARAKIAHDIISTIKESEAMAQGEQ